MAHIQNSSSSSTRRSLRLLTAERKSTATTTNEPTNIDEEEESQPTARQAKYKALEAISISNNNNNNNKRRSEPELDINDAEQNESEKQELEEYPTNSNSRKRTHSKQASSSSSHHSIRHVSNTVRRRKRSKKSTTRIDKLSSKTVKRQRQISSDEDDNRLSIHTKSKRNSAPILTDRTRSKSNLRKQSHSNSDLEQQSEGADTGNLCVRRGTGTRELNTVVSDPSTTNSRRSRASVHHRRYSNKTPIDYLTTGQSSSSRSSVPVTNTGGIDGRPCDSNSSLPSSTHPLHLFNSPAYYQQTASPPPSSSAQSFSGVVPTASYSSPFLASAASASTHRNTKHSLPMSTESDTDPENNGGHMSPSPRDVLSDPAFARAAAAAAAAGGPTSAALFHTLSGRVQHLMSRVGGSSSVNAINGRLQQYIQGIQSPDPDVRLTTLNELCSLLVMSNEETLPGFQFRVLYPSLRDCLADENEANAEIVLTACRALTYLMEALPRSAAQIVEATPIFLSKLRSITSIDIAEQVLTALEMISKRNGKQILIALLVMSNEETLPGFQFRVLYPSLRDCLADKNEANAEIVLTACRTLTYLMKVLLRSAAQIVEATPIFLSKLRSITSIDIAEQVLTALEMISKRNGKQILITDGISACLEYIEFFSITSQNKALSIIANCCIHILTRNDFNYICGHLENLSNSLRSDDKKTVEHVCTIFSRLVENFHRDSFILREIASTQLLKTMQTMLVIQPSLLISITFVSIIHMLFIFSAYCPTLAVTLLKMNIADTIIYLLTGTNDNKSTIKSIPITYISAALSTTNESISMNISSIQETNNIELIPRTPQELYEIVSLIGEMMPHLPADDPLFQIDQLFRRTILSHRAYDASSNGYVLWHWQDDQGKDFCFSSNKYL
ncbi:unnamed protein product [Rotaria sp. Silwood2]|nr:unnamed protein product [Rotaria sp. Silwood2]